MVHFVIYSHFFSVMFGFIFHHRASTFICSWSAYCSFSSFTAFIVHQWKYLEKFSNYLKECLPKCSKIKLIEIPPSSPEVLNMSTSEKGYMQESDILDSQPMLFPADEISNFSGSTKKYLKFSLAPYSKSESFYLRLGAVGEYIVYYLSCIIKFLTKYSTFANLYLRNLILEDSNEKPIVTKFQSTRCICFKHFMQKSIISLSSYINKKKFAKASGFLSRGAGEDAMNY